MLARFATCPGKSGKGIPAFWWECGAKSRAAEARPRLCAVCRAQAFRLCAIGSGEQSRPFESGEQHHVCILESSGKKEKPDQAGKSVVRKGILLSGALDDTNLKILWRGGGAASSWAPGSVGQWGLREFRAFGGRRLLFPNK